jgi:hypothetical protein
MTAYYDTNCSEDSQLLPVSALAFQVTSWRWGIPIINLLTDQVSALYQTFLLSFLFVLDNWKKIWTISWKQNTTIQINPKAHMVIRNSPLGHGRPIQYRNTSKISKQNTESNNQRTTVRTKYSPTYRLTDNNHQGRNYEAQHHPHK